MHIDDIELAEPFMSLFPRRADLEAEIADDMERDGFDEAFPLIVWNNILVDGYHRYYAADKNRIHTLPVVEKDFDSEDEAVLYGIRANARRRHLSDAELVSIVLEVDKRNKAIGEARRNATLKQNEPFSTNVENGADCIIPIASHKQTAADLGIGRRKVEEVRAIHEHGTEEDIQEVKDGKTTIHKKAEEVRGRRKPTKKIAPVDYRSDAQKMFDNAHSELVRVLIQLKRDEYEGVSYALIRQEIQKLLEMVRTKAEMEGNNDGLT